MNQEIKDHFLERSKTIRILWVCLILICILTLIPEFFIQRKAHFGFDGFFGFYALLGFISCALLIILAKLGGIFLKKDEDYYSDNSE